jgi:hypothetical protein
LAKAAANAVGDAIGDAATRAAGNAVQTGVTNAVQNTLGEPLQQAADQVIGQPVQQYTEQALDPLAQSAQPAAQAATGLAASLGALRDAVTQFANDPEVQKLANDPAFQAQVQSGAKTYDQSKTVGAEPSKTVTPGQDPELHDKAAFRWMFQQDFADLQIREDVPVAELGGDGKPYDFGVYRLGQLAGVVMLTPHNRDNNRAFKGAKQAAINAGVPFINFYLHMPNERSYASRRIRSLLR